MRRVVIVVPSLFTLFNLFFGIWSMVLASRGEFYRAGWYIFFAGVLDALDGRVARLSRTGTRFGAELDSLVDVVSFGVAPAFLIYQLEFATGRHDVEIAEDPLRLAAGRELELVDEKGRRHAEAHHVHQTVELRAEPRAGARQ